VLCGFVALYAATTLVLATRRHLWFDELFTYYIVRQPSIGDVLDVLRTGVEPLPPFFYLLTRGSIELFGDGPVGMRLPGLIGVLLACVSLYILVSRRSTRLHGVLAMFVPLVTTAYSFAPEARPYGLVLGLSAAALLCWQLRCDGVGGLWPVAGLAASLTLAVASHYYAVFVLVPIALGEAVRARTRRELDLPVIGALATALVPLALAAEFIRAAHDLSSTFWAKPELSSSVDFFGWLVRTPAVPPERVSTGEAAAFSLVAIGVALYLLLAPLRTPRVRAIRVRRELALIGAGVLVAAGAAAHHRDLTLLAWVGLLVAAAGIVGLVRRRGTGIDAPPAYEVVAAGAFALLPLVCVVVAGAITGAYVHRYALPAVIAPAVLLPLAVHRLDPPRVVAPTLVVLTAAFFGAVFLDDYDTITIDRRDERVLATLVSRAADEFELPVAISHPHAALELSRYGPRAVTTRMLNLAGPAEARRFVDSDSTELALLELDPLAPLDVEPFETYIRSNRAFVLLWKPYFRDWLRPALEAEGRSLRPIRVEHGWTLYRVAPGER